MNKLGRAEITQREPNGFTIFKYTILYQTCHILHIWTLCEPLWLKKKNRSGKFFGPHIYLSSENFHIKIGMKIWMFSTNNMDMIQLNLGFCWVVFGRVILQSLKITLFSCFLMFYESLLHPYLTRFNLV